MVDYPSAKGSPQSSELGDGGIISTDYPVYSRPEIRHSILGGNRFGGNISPDSLTSMFCILVKVSRPRDFINSIQSPGSFDTFDL